IENVINFLNSKKKKKNITLTDGIFLYIDYPDGVFYQNINEEFEYKVEVGKKMRIEEFGFEFTSNIIKESYTENKWKEVVDFDRLKGSLILRNWKAGDKFVPLGMKKEKKLSDFFIDEKVPFFERKRIPLLVSNNEIVWVCGYRISENIKVTEKTKIKLGLNFKLF
ncbi:hypothetical protein DRQ09_10490, partial [candidate division KSB1 bacterium]